MKKSKFKQLLLILMYVGIGAVGGIFLGNYLIENDLSFLQLIYIAVAYYLTYYLAIIIHEAGHLVMGLKTGYEFVSFRVGSLTWIKENGNLVRKKFAIAGTGGQCIMMPKHLDNPEEINYFLYNLGGGLFNLISAAISLPLGLYISNFYLKMPLIIFGIVSLILGITNLIPMNLQAQNDGYNLYLLHKDKDYRDLFYKNLRIVGLLNQGYKPSEIPEELFEFKSTNNNAKLLKASQYVDKKDFVKAEELLTEIVNDDKISSVNEYEAKSELLFCKIMNKDSSDEIDKLYDKDLQKYVSLYAKTHIAKLRLRYAYYLIYKEDEESAQKEYEAAIKMKDSYPIKGEYLSEMELIEYVKNCRL